MILMALSFSQLIYLAISLPLGLFCCFSTFRCLKSYCHKHPHIESLNLFQSNPTIRTEGTETWDRERGFFRLPSAHLCLLGNCTWKRCFSGWMDHKDMFLLKELIIKQCSLLRAGTVSPGTQLDEQSVDWICGPTALAMCFCCSSQPIQPYITVVPHVTFFF